MGVSVLERLSSMAAHDESNRGVPLTSHTFRDNEVDCGCSSDRQPAHLQTPRQIYIRCRLLRLQSCGLLLPPSPPNLSPIVRASYERSAGPDPNPCYVANGYEIQNGSESGRTNLRSLPRSLSILPGAVLRTFYP